MSCNYADGLSAYSDKGVLGIPEKFDDSETIDSKVNNLVEWILQANHVVVHTGAGISTSAGIPDFRGPNGVWTLESKGLKPSINISFDNAIPTFTHMALKKMCETGHVKYIISQNIDGLHLRSGIPRDSMAELHGNMFTEKCNTCERQFVRKSATTSVGQKCLGSACPGTRNTGRPCRGKLYDTILDWEANLPTDDLNMADYHSSIADLNICLGTTLQIVPSGTLPLNTKKYGGKLVIINLQPTKHDKKADLIIHTYVDDVLKKVMKRLGLEAPEYSDIVDPTKSGALVSWTMCPENIKKYKIQYNERCKTAIKRRRMSKVEPKEEKTIKKEENENEVKNEDEKNGDIKNEPIEEVAINEDKNDIKMEEIEPQNGVAESNIKLEDNS